MALTQAEKDALLALYNASEDISTSAQDLIGVLIAIKLVATEFPNLVTYSALKAQFQPAYVAAKNALDAAVTALNNAQAALP